MNGRGVTYLSLNGVTTLFTEIHEVQDSSTDVSESSNRLHLDSVHLLKRVVQDTGSVDDLPSEVLVVHVTNKEGFGGEGVLLCQLRILVQVHSCTYGLNVDIGSGDLVDETTLADIGVTTNKQCSGVGVDSWQSRDVLPDLLQVRQRILLPLHDSSHSTESGSFELFTSVERITEFQ